MNDGGEQTEDTGAVNISTDGDVNIDATSGSDTETSDDDAEDAGDEG